MRHFKQLLVLLITAFAFSAGYANPPSAPPNCIYQTEQLDQEIAKVSFTTQTGISEAYKQIDASEIFKWETNNNLFVEYSYCKDFGNENGIYKAGVSTNINSTLSTSIMWKNLIFNETKLIKHPQSTNMIRTRSASLDRVIYSSSNVYLKAGYQNDIRRLQIE